MAAAAAARCLAAALALGAVAHASFQVTQGPATQSFVACVAGDGTPAGSPFNNPNTVAAQIVEYTLTYNSVTGRVAVAQTSNQVLVASSGAPASGSTYQLSIPGDFADRGRAIGMVTPSGSSCTTASGSVPTLACQGTPLSGMITLTADNRYVVLAGYDTAAGTNVVPLGSQTINAAMGQPASTIQNISLLPVNVNRVVGVVDLMYYTQQVAVSVSSACQASGVAYPCEITSATYVKNASDPAGSGSFYVATGWGSTSAPQATTGTTRVPFGIFPVGFTVGLPTNGGLIQVPAPSGIMSNDGNIGTKTVIQTAAGGSTWYIKYVRSPKVYNNTLYYALNSKGVSACSANGGMPLPGQSCSGNVVAEIFLAFANTAATNVKDYVFTGASTLWLVDGDLGLHYFNCPTGGSTATTACGGTAGQTYVTIPPNAFAWTSLLVNSSLVSVTAVQEQAGFTTFILVAQQSVVWAWPAANSGPYVDGIGNCCGPANRATAGASCCWANGNQPVATAPANTFFRSLAAPAFGTAPLASPAPSVSPSNTPTISLTPSTTPSNTPSNSFSSSLTPSVTSSPSMSASITSSPSSTPSMTPTPTPTTTLTAGASPSNTPSISVTPSVTPTNTRTPSITPSPTQTPSTTTTLTATPTRTASPTASITPSNSPTPSQTPSPTQSKGSAPLPPLTLSWGVVIGWANPGALTAAQAMEMSPTLVCDSYVSQALLNGYASLLGVSVKNVAIASTTDSASQTVQTVCARRLVEPRSLAAASGGGRALQVATTETVAMTARMGPSLGVRDQAAALAAVVNSLSPASPIYQQLINSVATATNLSASLFALVLDPTHDPSLGGVTASTASSGGGGSGATSAVGGALGGIVGAIAVFAGFATLRYYMTKGRLPPIFGKSTKSTAQKRDISAVRAENEALKANPLAAVRLSKEDSQKIADSLAEMTPEELEELKELKARKRAEKAAKNAAAEQAKLLAAASGGAGDARVNFAPSASQA